MSSKNKKSSKKGEPRASLITRLIAWFDSYVGLYVVDPIRIERALRGYEGTDLEQIWKSVKSDVYHIAELPMQSEEVKKYSKLSSRARLLSIVLTAGGFLLIVLFFQFRNQLGILGPNTLVISPGIFIALMYIVLMVSM